MCIWHWQLKGRYKRPFAASKQPCICAAVNCRCMLTTCARQPQVLFSLLLLLYVCICVLLTVTDSHTLFAFISSIPLPPPFPSPSPMSFVRTDDLCPCIRGCLSDITSPWIKNTKYYYWNYFQTKNEKSPTFSLFCQQNECIQRQ